MANAKKKKSKKNPEEPLKLNMSFEEAVSLSLKRKIPKKKTKK